MAVVGGRMLTVPPFWRATTAVSSMLAIQVVCAARPAVPLVRRVVAATVTPTGLVAVPVIFLAVLLPPPVFSCAGFVRGAVTVVGAVLCAGAMSPAGPLCLGPGCLRGFWWVA